MNTHENRYLPPLVWTLAMAALIAAMFAAASCMGSELPPAIMLVVSDNAGNFSPVSDKLPSLVNSATELTAPAKGVGKQISAQPVAMKDGQSAALTLSDTAAPALTPIQQCLARLTADLTAYEATAGSLTTAQAQLAAIQATVAGLVQSTSAAQQAVAQDQQALAALTGPVVPPVNPPAPTGPQISVLAITATGNWCPACTALKPTLDAMKAKGEPISILDPADAAAAKWNAPSVPTVLMLLDQKEVCRWVPSQADPHMSVAQMQDWISKSRLWANTYFPPKAKGE